MPKPQPIEYFEVTTRCPKENLGELMAAINKLGIDDVKFDLVTEVAAFKGNGKHDVSGEEYLKPWVADHPTFRSKEVVAYFRENGRAAPGAYYAIKMLVEKGILKSLGNTQYTRADVKHLPAPKKKAPIKKFFDKSGADVVLTYAKRNHGRFNTTKLIEVFEKDGRAKNSVYASINELVATKLAKRVGEKGSGSYVLLQKAATAKTAPKHAHRAKEEIKKPNGAAPVEPAEVTTNG